MQLLTQYRTTKKLKMQLLTQYRTTKKLKKNYYKAVIVEQCAENVLMSFYSVLIQVLPILMAKCKSEQFLHKHDSFDT